MGPKGESHYLDKEGRNRHIESRKHPNKEDINELIDWANNIID